MAVGLAETLTQGRIYRLTSGHGVLVLCRWGCAGSAKAQKSFDPPTLVTAVYGLGNERKHARIFWVGVARCLFEPTVDS